MRRTRAIVLVLFAAGVVGLVAAWPRSLSPVFLDCDGGAPALGADGVVGCQQGAVLPAGQALTLGRKFNCNTASEADFALVPGVGAAVAKTLVEARGAGFSSWEAVDAVPGVGGARLTALQGACDIRWDDAGVW